MDTILLATDLREASRTALRTALKLAAAYQSSLIIFHPFLMLQPAGGNRHAYKKKLAEHETAAQHQIQEFVDQYMEELREVQEEKQEKEEQLLEKQSLELHCVVSHESPAKELERLVGEYDPDLLIIPDTDPEELTGRKVPALIDFLPCALLKVPEREAESSFKQLVYATDFGDSATHILPFLEGFITHFESKINCLHIRTPRENGQVHDELDALKYFLEDSLKTEVATTLLAEQEVVNGITAYVEQQEVDLLVMETRTHSFLERALHLHSKAQKVAATVQAPILIVRKH